MGLEATALMNIVAEYIPPLTKQHPRTAEFHFDQYEAPFSHLAETDLTYHGFLRVFAEEGGCRLHLHAEGYWRLDTDTYEPRSIEWIVWCTEGFYPEEVSLEILPWGSTDEDWLFWSFYIDMCCSLSSNVTWAPVECVGIDRYHHYACELGVWNPWQGWLT